METWPHPVRALLVVTARHRIHQQVVYFHAVALLVVLAGTLSSFHLPMEGVAVLLGIDAVLDMARTSVNVLGNCLASAVVARWEGVEFRAAA